MASLATSNGMAILAIKSSLLIGIGLLLWAALRKASASARHLVMVATLVAAILVPIVSFVVPPINLPVLNAGDFAGTATPAAAPIAAAPPTVDTETAVAPAFSPRTVAQAPTNMAMTIYLLRCLDSRSSQHRAGPYHLANPRRRGR